MPATYAIAYSPTATGGTTNTSQTGSFYIGNMNTKIGTNKELIVKMHNNRVEE